MPGGPVTVVACIRICARRSSRLTQHPSVVKSQAHEYMYRMRIEYVSVCMLGAGMLQEGCVTFLPSKRYTVVLYGNRI